MTVWRLPDLTGLELHEADRCILHGVPAVSLELPDGRGYVDLPLAVLVEVKPPLPEPPNLTVLRAGDAVYQRDDQATEGQWWMAGRAQSTDWASIAHVEFEVLVPAPEPTALPWRDGPLGVYVDPNGLGGGPHKVVVSVRGHTAHVTSLVARATARALWTAADAAEAQP